MLIIAIILTCLMLTVIISDSTRYIIPNWLVGLVVILYPAVVLLSPVKIDWGMALLIGLGTFLVGFILFITKAMGGGDVKLLTAASLYVGTKAFLDYIMGVAILGGLIAILLILIRPIVAFICSKFKSPPTIAPLLTIGEPVPYGVAIAVAYIYLLWMGKLPGLLL